MGKWYDADCCQKTRVVGAPCPVGRKCPHDGYTPITDHAVNRASFAVAHSNDIGVSHTKDWFPGDPMPDGPAPEEPPHGVWHDDMHTYYPNVGVCCGDFEHCQEPDCDNTLLAHMQREAARAPKKAAELREQFAPDTKPTNPKDSIGIRKVSMSVLPFNVLAEVAVGMMEGAAKYGRHNYRGVGVRSSVYYDATMRHLGSYWEGEDTDPDSGLSHITKAICSLVVWRDAMMQGKLTDDRPPPSVEFMAALNEASAAMLDKHADKSPKHWTIEDAR